MLDIVDLVVKNKKYYIYGINTLGTYCIKKIDKEFGIDKIIAYIESEGRPKRKLQDGEREILTPKEAYEKNKDAGVIITGRASKNIMIENCISAGFKEEDIICPGYLWNYIKPISHEEEMVRKVYIWPDICEYNEDLLNKINWFLPNEISISACVTDDRMKEGLCGENLHICSEEEKNQLMEEADYVLVWDMKKINESIQAYIPKIRTIDPEFLDMVDSNNWVNLYYCAFSKDEKKMMFEKSKTNFIRFQHEMESIDRANIFCTGPSIVEAYEMEEDAFSDALNIVCNSMVKDEEMMNVLKPKAFTATDINFYFSPSAYGMQFSEDLRKEFHKHHFYFFTRDRLVPLVLHYYPEMEDYVIGISYRASNEIWQLNAERLEVRPLSNVLTEMMLPIATSVCTEINILGCTGRLPDENYFWQHNEKTQYLGLMQSVKDMWPAFFNYRNYGSYYEKHCENVEQMLCFGESIGKKFKSKTTTFIPALRRRE